MSEQTSFPEPLRRLPQQARSRQRLNQILDAAAQAFEEFGYEATTTEVIAMRANTSIGSLYRFFPDKPAILYALAQRYSKEMRELTAELFSSSTVGRSLASVLSDAVDAYDNFYRTQPAARIIFLQRQAAPELYDLNKRLDHEIALHLDAFFALKQPNMEPEKRRVVALVAVEVASALQLFYWKQEDNLQQKIVAETKQLLTRYLQPLLESTAL
ncbi:TetR/AcrR family transcriptional regulator [Scytonema sp. NUACC21]